MPTIFHLNGFDFIIYFGDHLPKHTHVFKAGEKLVINLGGENSSPTVRNISGMSRNNVKRALKIADEYQVFLLGKWNEINE